MNNPFRSTIIVMAVLTITLSVTTSMSAQDVFPDKNLNTVIREILKRKQIDKEEIADDDLRTIYFLHARNRDIGDLTGLEKCTNLADVDLAGNRIENLGPLSSCKNIQSLVLAKNRITDVSPLAKLEKLQYLQLDDNQVKDLSPLSGLKSLTSLYLTDNKVESLAPLSGLEKLNSLYLKNNQVKDVVPLKGLKWISSLDLSGNGIKDVSPLSGMTELRYTFLQGNQIQDIGPLVTMATKDAEGDKRFAPYWYLYLAGNPLNEESKTIHIAKLKEVGVRVHLDDATHADARKPNGN